MFELFVFVAGVTVGAIWHRWVTRQYDDVMTHFDDPANLSAQDDGAKHSEP